MTSAAGKQRAPFGSRCRYAYTQKAQGGSGNNSSTDQQSRLYDNRRQAVRQDMSENNLPGGQAHSVGGLNIFQIAHGHNRSTHDTCIVRSAGYCQGNNQVDGAGAQQRYDYYSLQNVRDGVENINAAHDDIISLAAIKAGNRAQNSANQKAKANRADTDSHGIARAIHNAGKQITAILISTEPMLSVRRLQLNSQVLTNNVGFIIKNQRTY